MRVVLAGGGTAGHIEPALALADALRRLDPTHRHHLRSAPSAAWRPGWSPPGVTSWSWSRPVPLPRALTPQLLTVPGRLAGAVNAMAAVLDRVRADVLVGFGGYVATPAYLAAKRRGLPIVVHEANPRPGLANRLGARLTDHVFTGLPDPTGQGRIHRHPAAPRDRRPRPAVHGRQGPLLVRAADRPAHAAGVRRLPGGQVAQRGGPRRRARAARGRRPGAARDRPQEHRRARAAARRPAVRPAAVRRPHGSRLRRRRPGAVPQRRAHLRRAHRRRPARRLRAAPARQRRAARSTPSAIVAGGGGLMVDDAELSSEWIIHNVLPILQDPERVAAMSEAASRLGRKDAT